MKSSAQCIALLLFLVFVYSCKNNTDTKENLDNNAEMMEDTIPTADTTKPPTITKKIVVTKEDTDKFSKYLSTEMKGWKAVPEKYWLQPQYIKNYNNIEGIPEKISYGHDTSIVGDFNGDGFTDHSSILLDKNNQIHVLAFHQTEEGYDMFEISKGRILVECCLGGGISTTPPGIYSDLEGNKEMTIKNDAVIYSIYEKSKTLSYFDGTKYQTFFISD